MEFGVLAVCGMSLAVVPEGQEDLGRLSIRRRRKSVHRGHQNNKQDREQATGRCCEPMLTSNT